MYKSGIWSDFREQIKVQRGKNVRISNSIKQFNKLITKLNQGRLQPAKAAHSQLIRIIKKISDETLED